MKRLALVTGSLLVFLLSHGHGALGEEAGRVYQLRIYQCAPGKLGVLVDRFRAANLEIFARNGIKLEGAWVPLDTEKDGEELVYLVSFPSREAGQKAFEGFGKDPLWKETAAKEKEKHGTVVASAETVYLAPADFSPAPSAGGDARIYELRVYTASPGKMENLLSRFRDHTMKLFERHGIANVVYTTPLEGEKGAGETLVYMVSHRDKPAADQSWAAFRADPDWQKVYADSQADGVKLASKVVFTYLKPLDFSPLK